jgi:hypothetical protein
MTLSTDDPSPDDERTARAHMVLSALAIGLMGLALYLGYELTRPADDLINRCTEANKEETCKGDEECVDGQCKYAPELVRPQRCQENDPCGTCKCEGKFKCDAGNVCRALEPDRCSEGLIAAIRDTRRFEREQCRAQGKEAATCEPKDLEKFFIKHEDYDTLLASLEHRTTIHFDNGEPEAGGLSLDDERHYVESLAAVKQRFLDARHVLVIGRASIDSAQNQSSNYTLAQQRMLLVQKWLAGLDGTPQGRDEMRRKLITLAIGTANPLDAELLAKDEYHRYVTWSDRSTKLLREEVTKHANLSRRKKSDLHRRINQSVLVVPIPCEIPDDPAPAVAKP